MGVGGAGQLFMTELPDKETQGHTDSYRKVTISETGVTHEKTKQFIWNPTF